jgi:predicted RNA-binding Zn-ribbon protein involved in translation (DUF1610 family)
MTEAPTCDRCGRRIVDTAYVCPDCARELRRDLETVAKVAGEVVTTIARLDHIGERDGEGSPAGDPEARADNALFPMALPVNLDAGEQHDAAVNALTTWARHVHETSGRALPVVARRDEHPLAVLAAWLVDQLDWLRHRPEAADAFGQLSEAARTLVRIVDRPPSRWYAGPCGHGDCTETLRPVAGATTAICPACGAEHDLDRRRAWLLEQAEELWAPATRLAHLLTQLGVTCTPEMIRGYAHRGRLAPHPDVDPRGYPRYRLGSARELVDGQRREERERTLRAAVRAADLAERRSHRPAEMSA